MKKLLYLDTETTGFYANKHGLTQVAAIVVIGSKEKERIDLDVNLYSYPMPVSIEDEALEITGKTKEGLNSYPNQDIQAEKLCQMLEKYIKTDNKDDVFQIVGYNTAFDTSFIKKWFKLNNIKYTNYFTYREIDILALARHMQLWGMLKTENAKLGTLCEHYKIKLDAHDAMNDIVATRELYKTLVIEMIKYGYTRLSIIGSEHIMGLNALKCNLCQKKHDIRHILMPFFHQEEALNGKHIHICTSCYKVRYDWLVHEIENIENKILADVMKGIKNEYSPNTNT